jgi:signal transduction histidine kinase
VCREIIEKHGGRISVSSNGDHDTGSVFSVFLPEVCKNCDDALLQSENPAA